MTTPSSTASLEFPCPKCGYDLRATPWQDGRRCPECGTVSRGGVRSRIPWAHRLHRGRFKAFLATIWMVLRRPGTLTREPWINPRDARSFHRTALWTGTLIATLLLMGAFFARGDQWRLRLAAHPPTVQTPEPGEPPERPNIDFPINALTDSAWIALPMGISIYIASALSMWVYRGFLRVATGKRRHRERIRRISYYASAILPVTLTFLGLLAIGGMVLYEEHPWLQGAAETLWTVGLCIFAGLTLFSFYVPTMVLVWKTGKWRIARTALMFPIYPYIAMPIFAGIAAVVFWATGYAAIAVWSMIH